MYDVYTVDAIVLGSINIREAHKQFWLLTKDFGVVRATAQGIRYLKSKLRYHLQDGATVKLSIVRGKEGWRITNAYESDAVRSLSLEHRKLFARLLLLIRRLVHGEESTPLYDIAYATRAYLEEMDPIQTHQYALEHIAMLRILFALGYVSPDTALRPFVEEEHFSPEMLEDAQEHREVFIKHIQDALEASHL